MTEGAAWFYVWIPKDAEEKVWLQLEEEKNQVSKEEGTVSEGHHKHHHHKHHHKHHKKEETSEPSKDEITKSQNLPSNEITDILSGTSVKVIEVQSIADKSKDEDISEKDETEVHNEDVDKNVKDVGSKLTEETDDGKCEVEKILSMEKILVKELEKLSASKITWQTSPDKKFKLCIFYVSSGEAEDVLTTLRNVGIGHDFNSTISVFKTSLHYTPTNTSGNEEAEKNPGEEVKETGSVTTEDVGGFEDKIDRFYSSIKSRMMVGEVITNIENNAHFTFDFLMLLTLASIIAFIGLVESSSVTLVASMLISPLMGPILAGIFGVVVGDSKLRNLGIINELISLVICVLSGFVMGLVVCPWIETYGVPQWPTQEMVGRGQLRSLWVGVLVAVPSGAGVALSVLGGNAGSLVGVAISASLLPPAVNAGFFWCLSMLIAATGGKIKMFGPEMIKGHDDNSTETHYTEFKLEYSDDQAMEAFILGVVSLGLTFLNILCIIITGIAILRLKEVTPDKIPQTFSEFWKTDVKSRRGKYSRLDEEEALLEEGKEFGLDGTIIQGLFEEAQKDEDMRQIQRWVVTTQNIRSVRKPYSYTVINSRQSIREGPGYRVNKTTLLRQQQMKKLQEAAIND